MGLGRNDSKPVGISVPEAYRAIRNWYQANINRPEAAKSRNYIASLPPVENATRDQMIDSLRRVISRDLEWAYHEFDGKYKMAAYATAALDADGAGRI